jgi:uncharacterized RDD family membrane protein YckC
VADVLDVVVVAVLIVVGYLSVSAFRLVLRPGAFRWPDLGAVGMSIVGAAVFAIYLTVLWTATGRTVGKQVMGLRVIRARGGEIGLARALARAILCVVFPVGLLWCLVDRRDRALHDLVLGSAVVYDWGRRPI